ncbi:hypothetical protein KEM60_03280 [Austwickia sp. TVS 96-490-7B]|uniref:hypothetical protein n=1 Tax=Austwickia sp. TVS 96-490-7B TaxID=2830843 RepID=UPI001C598310|nr:hypothetical protein [Austwickia sp. TVS 96-490-7B]MBW3087050.1 hypothetical protein [Austwickia sp. TVS 96-490-7B]
MSIAAWEAELTRLEDELDTQEEALRTGQVREVAEFAPPDSLGPLPPQLADRATHLMQRTALLATFVQYQLAATDADLRFEQRTSKHAGAQALYLDRSV